MSKKILIIGASGLIGRYLFRHFSNNGNEVIGTYYRTRRNFLFPFDVTNPSFDNLPSEKFDYAILCSALSKIDECKKNPEYSRKINVEGLEKVLSLLSEKSIFPIFISGAAVFDGFGQEKESDLRNPANLYGAQKLEVEDFIKKYLASSLIVRPGKVFGVNKGEGIFSDWLQMYKNRQQILCADDENLSLTYAKDLARGIACLIEKKAEGVYHINPPEHYTIFEIASKFFDFLGIKNANIIKCSLSDICFFDKRAKNVYLNASKFIQQTNFRFTPINRCFELIKKVHL